MVQNQTILFGSAKDTLEPSLVLLCMRRCGTTGTGGSSRVFNVGCYGLDHLPRVHQEQTDGYGAATRATLNTEGDLIPWKFLKRCRDIKMHV